MMIAGRAEVALRVEPFTKRFFRCVACSGKEFSVEHVMGRVGESFSWSCDECPALNIFTVNADGTLDVVTGDKEYEDALAVVRIDGSVHAVLSVLRSTTGTPEEQVRRVSYWLEEHTCPTNPEILEFVYDGEVDPHGMWKLLGLATAPPPDVQPLDHLRLEFPELYEQITTPRQEP